MYVKHKHIPKRGSAGFNLHAPETKTYPPGTHTIDLGLRIEPPEGYHALLATRSSMVRKGMLIIASVVKDDAKVTFKCDKTLRIHEGERIAQLILVKDDPQTQPTHTPPEPRD